MALNRRWVFWQVLTPLIGPGVLAGVVAFMWHSLDNSFQPKLSVIADISPWATVFYCMSTVAITMDQLWEKMVRVPGDTKSRGYFVLLLFIAFAVLVYNTLFVIKRHDTAFVLPKEAIIVTAVLLAGSVVSSYLGHEAAAK